MRWAKSKKDSSTNSFGHQVLKTSKEETKCISLHPPADSLSLSPTTLSQRQC